MDPGLKYCGYEQIQTPRAGAIVVWQPNKSYRTATVDGRWDVFSTDYTGHVSVVSGVNSAAHTFSSEGANQGCPSRSSAFQSTCVTASGCDDVTIESHILYPQSGLSYWIHSSAAHLVEAAPNSTLYGTAGGPSLQHSGTQSGTPGWVLPVLIVLGCLLALTLFAAAVALMLARARQKRAQQADLYQSMVVRGDA